MSGIKDEPNKENDQLGVAPYAKSLSLFIKNSETPLTIGVQGPWGSGKTSLLYSVWDELEKDDEIAQIWVNSWEHSLMSKSEETLIKITKEIAEEILKFDQGADRKEKLKQITGKLLKGGLSAGATIAAGAKGAEAVNSILSNDVEAPIKQLRKELEETVKTIVNRDENTKKRFIIYIDDLDRIEPSDAVSLLELLKNIYSLDSCIFVLAIDYEVVIKGLSTKFGQRTTENEREYKAFFDKVIQLTFKMPMNNYDIGNYVYGLLEKTKFLTVSSSEVEPLKEYFKNVVSFTVKGNPRSIKRLVNSLTLMDYTSKEIKQKNNETIDPVLEKKLLFAMVCLQISMQDVYNLVATETNYWSWKDSTILSYLGLIETDQKFDEILENAKETEYFDDEWEQALLRFSYIKGYNIAEITDCSRLLNYLKDEILNQVNNNSEIIDSIILKTNVTSVGNQQTASFDDTKLNSEFWMKMRKYFENNYDYHLNNSISKKPWWNFANLKNGYTISLMFGKRQKELIVKLEAYKADITIDEFREVAKQIIAKNEQYILDIQDKRKRMDLFIKLRNFDFSKDEQDLEDAFEWAGKQLGFLIEEAQILTNHS